MSIEFSSLKIEKNIPYSKFPSVDVEINGEKKRINGKELRKLIMDYVHGGKSRTQTEAYLEDIGIKGNQFKKRRDIMKLLDEELAELDQSI